MTNLRKLSALNKEEQHKFLTNFIWDWAELGGKFGSYIHDLTKSKEGYQFNTVSIDDFKEWDDERVAEVASEFLEWLNEEEK